MNLRHRRQSVIGRRNHVTEPDRPDLLEDHLGAFRCLEARDEHAVAEFGRTFVEGLAHGVHGLHRRQPMGARALPT